MRRALGSDGVERAERALYVLCGAPSASEEEHWVAATFLQRLAMYTEALRAAGCAIVVDTNACAQTFHHVLHGTLDGFEGVQAWGIVWLGGGDEEGVLCGADGALFGPNDVSFAESRGVMRALVFGCALSFRGLEVWSKTHVSTFGWVGYTQKGQVVLRSCTVGGEVRIDGVLRAFLKASKGATLPNTQKPSLEDEDLRTDLFQRLCTGESLAEAVRILWGDTFVGPSLSLDGVISGDHLFEEDALPPRSGLLHTLPASGGDVLRTDQFKRPDIQSKAPSTPLASSVVSSSVHRHPTRKVIVAAEEPTVHTEASSLNDATEEQTPQRLLALPEPNSLHETRPEKLAASPRELPFWTRPIEGAASGIAPRDVELLLHNVASKHRGSSQWIADRLCLRLPFNGRWQWVFASLEVVAEQTFLVVQSRICEVRNARSALTCLRILGTFDRMRIVIEVEDGQEMLVCQMYLHTCELYGEVLDRRIRELALFADSLEEKLSGKDEY